MEDLFFVESEERKFRIIVEDRCLYVSKESLASLSPVFKRIMYGDFKEAKENTIRLKEKKLEDILHLMHAIFPVPKCKTPITFGNFNNLMTFADEYDISQLRLDGEQFLKAEIVRLPVGDYTFLKVGAWASKFWLREIVEICVFPHATFDKYKAHFRKNVLLAIAEAKLNRITRSRTCKGANYGSKCTRCNDDYDGFSTRRMNRNKFRSSYAHSECFHDITCTAEPIDETDFSVAKTCLCGLTFDKALLDD